MCVTNHDTLVPLRCIPLAPVFFSELASVYIQRRNIHPIETNQIISACWISTLGRVLHYQCKAAHFYSASDFKVTYQVSGRWLTFIQSCHGQEQPRWIKTRATLGVMRWEVQHHPKYLLGKHKITHSKDQLLHGV